MFNIVPKVLCWFPAQLRNCKQAFAHPNSAANLCSHIIRIPVATSCAFPWLYSVQFSRTTHCLCFVKCDKMTNMRSFVDVRLHQTYNVFCIPRGWRDRFSHATAASVLFSIHTRLCVIATTYIVSWIHHFAIATFIFSSNTWYNLY